LLLQVLLPLLFGVIVVVVEGLLLLCRGLHRGGVGCAEQGGVVVSGVGGISGVEGAAPPPPPPLLLLLLLPLAACRGRKGPARDAVVGAVAIERTAVARRHRVALLSERGGGV
jgi:hypothetical protein